MAAQKPNILILWGDDIGWRTSPSSCGGIPRPCTSASTPPRSTGARATARAMMVAHDENVGRMRDKLDELDAVHSGGVT